MIISTSKPIDKIQPSLSVEKATGFTTDITTWNFCYITKIKDPITGNFSQSTILKVFDVNYNLISEIVRIPWYKNLSINDIVSFLDWVIVLECSGNILNEEIKSYEPDDEEFTINTLQVYTIITMNWQCIVKPGYFKSIRPASKDKFIAKIDNVDANSDALKKLKSIDMDNTICLFDTNENMLVDFTDYDHVDTINNTDQLYIVSKKDSNPKNLSNKVFNLCDISWKLLLDEWIERISANFEGTRLILGWIKNNKWEKVWKLTDISLNEIPLRDELGIEFTYNMFDFFITYKWFGIYKHRKLWMSWIYNDSWKIIIDSETSSYSDIDPYSWEYFGAWKHWSWTSFGSGAFFGPQSVGYVFWMIDKNWNEITPFVFKTGTPTVWWCYEMECLDTPEVISDDWLGILKWFIKKDKNNKAIFSPDGRQLLTLQRKIEILSNKGKRFNLWCMLLNWNEQNISFDDIKDNLDFYNVEDFVLDIDCEKKWVIEVNWDKRYLSWWIIDTTLLDSDIEISKIAIKIDYEDERYISFWGKKYLKKVLNI